MCSQSSAGKHGSSVSAQDAKSRETIQEIESICLLKLGSDLQNVSFSRRESLVLSALIFSKLPSRKTRRHRGCADFGWEQFVVDRCMLSHSRSHLTLYGARRTAVSCPGKVLIAGGYLVLDPAYTGAVVATSSRFYTVVEDVIDDAQKGPGEAASQLDIEVRSPQFRQGRWTYRVDCSGGQVRVSQVSRPQYVVSLPSSWQA